MLRELVLPMLSMKAESLLPPLTLFELCCPVCYLVGTPVCHPVGTPCVTLEDPGDLAPTPFSASSLDLSVLRCPLWLLSFSPGLRPHNLGLACQAPTRWWGCRGHCARGGHRARDGCPRRAGPRAVAWLQCGSWALVPGMRSRFRQLRPVQAPCPGWMLP